MTSDELCLLQVGKRITERRKKIGYTQEALAEKAELTPQFVSYAESGKRAMRPENLMKIARALNVSTDYLLTGEIIDKDQLLLSDKLRKLTATQFRTIESIADECIALNEKADK
jgi:Predicted transcriptional regulators